MINGKKVLAVVTARGGSKGLPRKNVLNLAGKPLIAWTIEAAKKSRYIDKAVLSSEDEEIIETASKYELDVPFVRPKELAQDTSSTVDVLLHAMGQLGRYDYLVVLQPTSPLRKAEDIDACIEMCEKHQINSCVSVCETEKPPFWTYYLDKDTVLKPVVPTEAKANRRQDLPKTYVLNGAVYVVNSEVFLANREFIYPDTRAVVMPRERSVDIDSRIDFDFAELLLKKT